MNHLSIHDAAYEVDPDLLLAERMRAIPTYERKEIVRRAVMWGTAQGIEEWIKEGGMSPEGFALEGLGQDALTSAVTVAVQNALRPLIPVLSEELLAVVKPAAEEAATIVGPVVANELKKKLPLFAVISGAVAAVLGILGMMAVGAYVVTKVG